jgi:hypothetical protein
MEKRKSWWNLWEWRKIFQSYIGHYRWISRLRILFLDICITSGVVQHRRNKSSLQEVSTVDTTTTSPFFLLMFFVWRACGETELCLFRRTYR